MTAELMGSEPLWPTMIRSRLTGGRLLGTDGSMWLVRELPPAPVQDARSAKEMLEAAGPAMAAIAEIAAMTKTTGSMRRLSRSDYRPVQFLTWNVPALYVPSERSGPEFLAPLFPATTTFDRGCLLAVRLRDSVGGKDRSLASVVSSVAQSIASGGIPTEDFDADYDKVDAALTRAGLLVPSSETLAIADSWFSSNQGYADVITQVQPDCLHFFSSIDAARLASTTTDPDVRIPGKATVTMATVTDLDFGTPFMSPTEPGALWVTELLDAGALAISVRAKIEPADVTRAELRRQRRKYLVDQRDAAAADKMSRAERDEHQAMLTGLEDLYAENSDAPPTLVDASVVVAINGLVPDLAEFSVGRVAQLAPMTARQRGGLAEMMLCSPVRASAYLHDLPAQTVAAAGLADLSNVGDAQGALLGFTERDRQPALIDPMAAAKADSLPLFLGVGQTGAGKLLALDTPVPTPSGWTTIGELEVGDQVLGRDGRPCSVTSLSPIDLTPALYRVRFSDGQTVLADSNHQWVVSSWHDRNDVRHPVRLRADENWRAAHAAADRLERAGGETDPNDEVTLAELFDLVDPIVPGVWPSPESVRAALHMVDAPFTSRPVRRVMERKVRTVHKDDPVIVYPVTEVLAACIRAWEAPLGPTNEARWGERARVRAARARALMRTSDPESAETSREIARMLSTGDDQVDYSSVVRAATRAQVAGSRAVRQVSVPMPASNVSHPVTAVYPTRVALKSLAARLRQRYHDAPNLEPGERVLSTGEMLADLRPGNGGTGYAIRLAEALDLPEADLPVDPYVLGAWLGDGSSNGGGFTGVDEEIWRNIEAAGYQVGHGADRKEHYIKGLVPGLRDAGVLNDKHVPAAYLRASEAQRLALLQGLMDTDGTIRASGGCELSLSDERLANGALELVRSLGIKASRSVTKAGYRMTDGTYRRCKDRHRIKFTTDRPVFRVERKAARLPAALRETSRWLYIDAIEPVPTMPGRCLTVDSPDSTYLVDGFIPTHNTMAAVWLATQFSRMGNPVIIIDPKMESDLSAPVQAVGGQVLSLDDLVSADGVFDPLRFSADPRVGADLAQSMLMAINPWGTQKDDFETPLMSALHYGVERGATCTGQALEIALAERPTEVLQRLVEGVRAAASSTLFRACVGFDPTSEGLRVTEKLTLIKVGRTHLDLPEPGSSAGASLGQRISLALVRMMVFGSQMALAGRDGVVVLDEAWIFLSAGKTEVERLGRLARSQRVLPMLFTQRVTDATDAGIEGYISRGIIGPIQDEKEALAACRLFRIEATPGRLARITAPARTGNAPNWGSMSALIDPATRQVERGSVWLYADLHQRVVPVEIVLPDPFLRRVSTNKAEIDARQGGIDDGWAPLGTTPR